MLKYLIMAKQRYLSMNINNNLVNWTKNDLDLCHHIRVICNLGPENYGPIYCAGCIAKIALDHYVFDMCNAT